MIQAKKKIVQTLPPEQLSQFYAKLAIFLQRVQDERNARTDNTMVSLNKSAKENGRVGYNIMGFDDQGTRFVRVWDRTGTSAVDEIYDNKSVTHFVEKATGIIFGAKGWVAYNPNHEYGTLDTIDEWNWEGYYAVNKAGKKSLVPKAARR